MRAVALLVLAVLATAASASKYLSDEDGPPESVDSMAGRACRVYYQITKLKYGRCQPTGPGVCVADDNRINIFSKDCGFLPDNK